MSAAAAITAGRRMAESLMVDTCTVRRQTGEVTDPNSGEVTPAWEQVYSGICKVQQAKPAAAAYDVGGDHLLLLRLEVHLPVTATGAQVGDEITIVTSAHDPDLVGQVFLVRDLAGKSFATARRLGVTRRTS